MGRKKLKVAAAVLMGLWFFYAIFFAGPWPGYLQFLTSAILVAAGFLALMSKLGKWELRPDGSVPWTGPRRRAGRSARDLLSSDLFGDSEGDRRRSKPVSRRSSAPTQPGRRW